MTAFRFSRRHRTAATWQNQQNECAPSEDSDQPGHPPSLIRVFAVRSVGSLGPKFLHADSEDSDQTGRMQSDCAPSEDSDQPRHPPSLIWVFAGRTVTLLVLSCRGSGYCSNQDFYIVCYWICQHDQINKQQNDLCAQRRLRSAWASAQSDQSLRCSPEEGLGP